MKFKNISGVFLSICMMVFCMVIMNVTAGAISDSLPDPDSDGVITLTDDVTLSSLFFSSGDLTVNLNSHTLRIDTNSNYLHISADCGLIVNGPGEFYVTTDNSDYFPIVKYGTGSIKLTDCTFGFVNNSNSEKNGIVLADGDGGKINVSVENCTTENLLLDVISDNREITFTNSILSGCNIQYATIKGGTLDNCTVTDSTIGTGDDAPDSITSSTVNGIPYDENGEPVMSTVTVSGGANTIRTGGDASQTVVIGEQMQPITYTAAEGFHFEDFTDVTTNNVTVHKQSDTVVTVTGSPTADADVTVPDAVRSFSVNIVWSDNGYSDHRPSGVDIEFTRTAGSDPVQNGTVVLNPQNQWRSIMNDAAAGCTFSWSMPDVPEGYVCEKSTSGSDTTFTLTYSYTVCFTAPSNTVVGLSNGEQTIAAGSTVETIAYSVPDPWYFKDSDKPSAADLKGLTLTVNDDKNEWIISGTPTGNVNITLPDPVYPTCTLTLIPGANASISGTNPQTVNKGSAITTIDYVAADNCWILGDLGALIYAGFSLSDSELKRISISGTLNDDLTFTLPDAVASSVYPAGAGTVSLDYDIYRFAATPEAGYKFWRWEYTRAETGTTVGISEQNNYSPYNDEKTLKAVFRTLAPEEYTVTYDPGTAEGDEDTDTSDTVEYTLASAAPASWTPAEGAELIGWKVGTTVYQPGYIMELTGDITAVAVWSTDKVTVTLTGGANASAAGGSATQDVSAGSAMETVTYTADSGYKFPASSDLYKTVLGVTVKRVSDTVVTVSGTPEGSVELIVPDAEKDNGGNNNDPDPDPDPEPKPDDRGMTKPEYVPPESRPSDAPSSVNDAKTPDETDAPAEKVTPDKAADALSKIPEGGTLRVDMTEDTVLPKEALDALKGRDVDVEIDLGGGFGWTINGKDITNVTGDIDLGVSSGADGITADLINTVTGEHGSVTMTLAYDGAFGFRAILSVPIGTDSAGLFANLFRFEPAENAVKFIASGKIGSDGNALIPFDHASYYVIVIDTYAYEDAGVPANTETEPDSGKEITVPGDVSGQSEANPHTGAAVGGIAVLILAGAAIVVSRKIK